MWLKGFNKHIILKSFKHLFFNYRDFKVNKLILGEKHVILENSIYELFALIFSQVSVLDCC